MAIIQVTPETLRQKATDVRTYKSEHDDVIAKLKSIVNGLNETWICEAQDAFLAKFESMQSTFTNFSDMLEGYAKLMDTAATQLENTDQSLKQTMTNFG